MQNDFQIEVIGKILQDVTTHTNETFYQDEYYAGKLSDFQMIDKNMNQQLDTLKDSSEISYILNNKSYDTMEDFIHALHPNDYEEKALLFLLNHLEESLVVSNVTPNTVIEMLWEDHGLSLLKETVIASEPTSITSILSVSLYAPRVPVTTTEEVLEVTSLSKI